jgi:hypothetical protein
MKMPAFFGDRSQTLQRNLFRLEKNATIPELKDPFAYNILGNLISVKITKQFYSLQEPEFDEKEKQLFDIIKKSLYEIINIDTDTNIEEYLEKSIRIILSELDLNITEEFMRKLIYYTHRDFIGLGKIEAIFHDPLVSKVFFSNEILAIEHRIFNRITTDIMLSKEDILSILQKLAIKCNTELNPLEPEKEFKGEQNISYCYNPDALTQSRFAIQKKILQYPSPLDLLKQKKLSPEILAYLWLLIENRLNIFLVEDINLLNALSYFLPPHSKILTNIPDYYPNIYTTTLFGDVASGEDYALFSNYSKQTFSNAIITSINNVSPEGKVLCQVENGVVKSIKENKIELFVYKEGKFLFNLNNSDFMKSKGNISILIEELRLRTRLLNALSKVNPKNDDLRRIIYIYYENPLVVLKKVGVL